MPMGQSLDLHLGANLAAGASLRAQWLTRLGLGLALSSLPADAVLTPASGGDTVITIDPLRDHLLTGGTYLLRLYAGDRSAGDVLVHVTAAVTQ